MRDTTEPTAPESVLRRWGARDAVTKSGLFHSIYGTEGFQGFCLPLSYRSDIRALIGEEAELLCWIFCMVDRDFFPFFICRFYSCIMLCIHRSCLHVLLGER